ncbi:TPA: GntR family transcriptional regulator [Streptococcus equi subsp. zooepidemicus]|nr:GntR family transcriptional regulator [Streptococcus equi subsp. zooepidemicus]HEL0514043.1 GntR family transcriptional regulator [Streptococcus equi subsp. zooepidemicus]HEL0518076.1 GntR family transcriptional regulator [Streptococcus equi subsp. zooepidemicus]
MKIILINGSSTPLYEQIKNAVKENIIQEILSPDEQLPSVRQLSKELKVSILTVKKAYDELEKEGFIVVRQGLGTFVASLNLELIQEEKQKEIEENLIMICRMAKSINLSESELIDLIRYIYGGINNE